MNLDITRLWKQKKEKLKQKYPVITDADLRFSVGKEKEMMERLGNKLGKSIKELLTIIVTL
jgi:hypothetical protein